MVVNLLLVIISLAIILFGFGIWSFISIVGVTIISFYAAKRLRSKHKKLIFILSMILATGFLIAMKTLPIAYNETNSAQVFLAPFGITYYMMQVISYMIDVYKAETEPETNLIKYALYTTYVPHLFVGPVYDYNTAIDNLIGEKDFSWRNVVEGVLRAAWGGFKIFVIANRIAVLTNSVNGMPTGGAYVVFGMLLYGIQIYCAFSGGIDVALGVSKIFDIELPENFNSPFLAESVSEFWERFQTTIVGWVKKYIFKSSRKKKATTTRKIFNVLFSFFMIGFLLGNEFIIWAIINGVLTLVGTKLKTKYKALNRFLTYIALSFTWIFLIWPNGLQAISKLASIFTVHNLRTAFISIFNLGLKPYEYLILLFAFIALFVIDNNIEKVRNEIRTGALKFHYVLIAILALVTLFLGVN